jgi:hypothetical protein
MEQTATLLMLLVHQDFLGMELHVFIWEFMSSNAIQVSIGMVYVVFKEDLQLHHVLLDIISMALLVSI